jgi:hypothetical protein
MVLRDGKNLPWRIYRSLVVLGHDKGAGENQATDRKGMAVRPLWLSRFQVLGFNFGVPVGSQLRFEVDLVHVISPSGSIPL